MCLCCVLSPPDWPDVCHLCLVLSHLCLIIPASPSCLLAVASGWYVFVGQSSCPSGVVQPELTLTLMNSGAACQILLWGSKVAVQGDLGSIKCPLVNVYLLAAKLGFHMFYCPHVSAGSHTISRLVEGSVLFL